MEEAPVLFSRSPGREGDLALLTLNRPRVLNALNDEMISLLQQHLQTCALDADIKAVLIRAAEGPAFCAGGDLRSVYDLHLRSKPLPTTFFDQEYALNHYIYHYPKPYLALMDGITMGGGAGLSIHGGHRIGTERLLFAMPETGIGFFPDIGAGHFLSRLRGKMGIYLGLTGQHLSLDDCYALGLIDYGIAQKSIPQLLAALAEQPFGSQPKQKINQILAAFHQDPSQSGLLLRQKQIDFHFSQTSMEEIMASLEKAKEAWCQELALVLQKKSPTSLKVSLRQLNLCAGQHFDYCIRLDQRLARGFLLGHDFYEGIRALIIDKDKRPHWQPALLKAVDEATIESYFRVA